MADVDRKGKMKREKVGRVTFNLWNRETMVGSLPNGLIGAEVGVQRARFARGILNVCSPKRLYLVDCWEQTYGISYDDEKHLACFEEAIREVAKELCDGTVRLVPAWSRDGGEWVPDNSLDFVYIDGDHRLAGMRADLALWGPKVKRGGFIMGHDINLPQIKKALSEYTKQELHYTVRNNSFIYEKE